MKKRLLALTVIALLLACNKEKEFNELTFENAQTVAADLNKNVLLVHNSKLNNSNDSGGMEYNEETGIIVITKESAKEAGYEFAPSQILTIDLDTTAILRSILSIDTVGTDLYLETTQANMEDVFREADFELVSDFDDNISLEKSASTKDIQRTLQSGKQIKPARIIYNTEQGTFVQSVFQEEKLKNASSVFGESSKSIKFEYPLGGKVLYETGSNNTYASLSIVDGKVNLATEFVLATSIRWARLKKFRFEVKPSASVNAKVLLHTEAKYSKSGTKTIKNKVYSRTFIYYLGGVVLSVKIDCDICAGYQFDTHGFADVTSGFYGGMSADLGARWVSGKGWEAIRSFSHYEGFYPMAYNASADANLRVEVYPKATAYIYGINGISLDVVPYIKNSLTVNSDNGQQSYKASIHYGLDTRISARIKVLGKNLASYSSGNIQILSPKKLWSN